MATEAKTRVYTVFSKEGELIALVEAQNNLQVYSLMARKKFNVKVSDGKELFTAAKSGHEIEKAGPVGSDNQGELDV